MCSLLSALGVNYYVYKLCRAIQVASLEIGFTILHSYLVLFYDVNHVWQSHEILLSYEIYGEDVPE